MIGWVFTMKTPEYPEGRQLVAIANDITNQIGSFGPREDQCAREHGLPRIYLRRLWRSHRRRRRNRDPLLVRLEQQGAFREGVKYLYLTPGNHARVLAEGENIVNTTEVEDEKRHKITDFIGLQDGLGVECL